MDFTSLAFNPVCRMNEVSRYSSVYQETNETLAEHVTDVSVMGYLILRKMQSFGEDIDAGKLLEKCLLHDVDEVLTGDVPRNTKYATIKVHEELNAVAEEAVRKIDDSLDKETSIFKVWDEAKTGKEGVILKAVDMLCVVKKCVTEIVLRGNLSFLKVVTELEAHLNRMLNHSDEDYSVFECKESVELLKDLVSEALNYVMSIRADFQGTIDRYHIYENVIRGE